MIDVEQGVFAHVATAVSGLLAPGCFRSVYVPSATKFPCATLMETDNASSVYQLSSADHEEFALLTYEANVYAMSKGECRAVMDAIDTAMTKLGFTRTMMQFVPNLADNMIFRYIARYQAEAGHDGIIYRRA